MGRMESPGWLLASEAALDRLVRDDRIDLAPATSREEIRAKLAASARVGERSGQFAVLLMIDMDATNAPLPSAANAGLWLRRATERLAGITRHGDALLPLGGCRFAMILNGLGFREERAAMAATRIVMRLRRGDGGDPLSGSPWVGVGVFRGGGCDTDALVVATARALALAREGGKGSTRYADAALDATMHALAAIDFELQRAVERREFAVQFQPVADRLGRLQRVEALLRWRRPLATRLLGPEHFLDRAEETGLIVKIGYQAFEAVCNQLALWRHDARFAHAPISVNVGPAQLEDIRLVAKLRELIAAFEIEPSRLMLEIDEAALAYARPDCVARLDQLRALGLGLVVDGFRAAALSLPALRNLPVTELKLMPELLMETLPDEEGDPEGGDARQMPGDPVHALVDFAKRQGLRVVATRIETQQQWRRARNAGCDGFQGLLVGRPASGTAGLLAQATMQAARPAGTPPA